MQQTLQTLIGLQDIDADLFRVQKELERLPAERRRREEELERLERALEEARAQIHSEKSRVKEIEEQAVLDRQRIRKLEGEMTTSRDVAVIEHCRYDIRELKRRIDRSEREALEIMERIENAEASLEERRAALEAEREVFRQFAESVAEEIRDAERRRDELLARRQEFLSSDLDPQTLELYERLLAARDGQALSFLDGRICQSCYMEVPPNTFVRLARGTEVIQCPSCDRILVLRPE